MCIRDSPKLVCFILFVQTALRAVALAFARAGNKSDAKMAMIAITTNSSISVKAPILVDFLDFILIGFKEKYRLLMSLATPEPNLIGNNLNAHPDQVESPTKTKREA